MDGIIIEPPTPHAKQTSATKAGQNTRLLSARVELVPFPICLMAEIFCNLESSAFPEVSSPASLTRTQFLTYKAARASTLDLCLSQPPGRGLGGDWRVIDLFESIGLRFGGENREYLEVPVIVLVERLPVSQAG